MGLLLKLFLTVLLFVNLTARAFSQPLIVGILAKRGEPIEKNRFYPLEEYLKNRSSFAIEFRYLTFEELKRQATEGMLSFIITNSYQAILIKELALKKGFSYKIILSLGQYELGDYYPYFGGVIFTRKDAPVQNLAELKGKTFGAVNPDSFGGYLIGLYELYKAGLKEEDIKAKFYGTHDAVVHAVLKGEVFAGTVRTGILERMAMKGDIRLDQIKILSPKSYTNFPLLISSPLYPEWPVLANSNLPEKTIKEFARLLLEITPENSLAKKIEAVFYLPQDYSLLNQTLLDLMKGPYEELKGFYFQRFWKKYLPYFLAFLLVVIALLTFLTYNLYRKNRELNKTKEALKNEANYLDTVLRHTEHMIFQLDLEGNILWANQKGDRVCAEELGTRSLINIKECTIGNYLKSISEYFVKQLYQKEDRYNFVETVEMDDYERTYEGELVAVRRDGKPIYVLLFLRDVTEKSIMERQKLYFEKLNVLRNVAGGLAHDFNNLLSSLFNKLELMRLKLRSSSKVSEEISKLYNEINQVLNQLKILGRELLTLVRGEPTKKEKVNPLDLVKDYTNLALAGRINYSVEYIVEGVIPKIEVDRELFSIMWINLCLNAFEAMPKGGKVTIKLSTLNKEGQRFIRLEVIDHGIGIPEKHLPYVFDPFFTTKPHGTGLGLYIAKEVVVSHGGSINVYSKEGEGTRVEILLPAPPDEEPSRKPEVKTFTKKRILVMDNDDLVRESLQELLESFGYEVETAPDGEIAYKLVEESIKEGRPYDFVLLDLIVPGKWTGLDTYQEIKKIYPQVKAIALSGYFTEPVLRDYKKYNFYGALTKPFTIQDLLNLIEG